MKGQCLCGEVTFSISGEIPNIYQCHCSECRKATGSNANAATFVTSESFSWTQGKDKISSFKKTSGYRNDFCSVCGSSVPNPLRDTGLVWVPAGLLEDAEYSIVAAHLYMKFKASWESSAQSGKEYDESPGLEALNKALQRTSR